MDQAEKPGRGKGVAKRKNSPVEKSSRKGMKGKPPRSEKAPVVDPIKNAAFTRMGENIVQKLIRIMVERSGVRRRKLEL